MFFKNKKAIFALFLAVFGSLALYRSFMPTAEPVFTTMALFTDYDHPSEHNGRAIVYETLKTIDGGCSHIFINKKLFKELEQFVFPEMFIQDWQVYDTHIGLLYLRSTKATEQLGIKIDTFTLLEQPFDATTLQNVKDGSWTDQFHTLFDLKVWHAYHAHPKSKTVVYTNGHGTADIDSYALETLIGVSAQRFAQLLTFFNDQLRITFLGLQSCHWTAERVQKLMQKEAGIKQVRFTLLTPAHIEKPIWIETHINYLNNASPSFFDTCCETAYAFEGDLTKEIAETIKNTDTFQLVGNKNQQASLLAAGDTTIQLI